LDFWILFLLQLHRQYDKRIYRLNFPIVKKRQLKEPQKIKRGLSFSFQHVYQHAAVYVERHMVSVSPVVSLDVQVAFTLSVLLSAVSFHHYHRNLSLLL
jgi:hypothetical protein